ncbi:MAG: methylmalonyl-CoA mutase family protein [bacterium]
MAAKTSGKNKSSRLLKEFPAPSMQQWHEEVVRLLKGAPFDKKMCTETLEGITLQPLYTQADLEGIAAIDSLPGIAPFLRGTSPLGYQERPWDIAQEHRFPTPEGFNRALRYDLERGQNAVHLVLDAATQAGLDPDHAQPGEVGRDGTSIAAMSELDRALEGVDLETTPLYIQPGSAALPFFALVVALVRERDMDLKKLRGSVGSDPITGLAENGSLPLSLDRSWDELALLTKWTREEAPQLRTLAARGTVWHEGGANAVQELAFTMATAVAALRKMEKRGIAVDAAARAMQFEFSVGTRFFLEIAKLRAARLLWHRILEVSGAGETASSMHILARTSRYNKTQFDPHVNILRGTVEAFAAVMGGADAIHVDPFDEPLGLPGELARRLAKNTQLILREESHFDRVTDPAGGSWAVESLTHQLAEGVWKQFQEVGAQGGIRSALVTGWVQREITAIDEKRRAELQFRKEVLVGTTHYPNPIEGLPKSNLPNYAELYAERSAKMQTARTASNDLAELQVLESLNEVLLAEDRQVVERVIAAAHMGATIGEFTKSLRHLDDERPQVEAIRPRRAADLFERLRKSVLVWRDRHPDAPPLIFLACIGPHGRYMPRLDFTRSFFHVGGFSVESEKHFDAIDDAVNAAGDLGSPVVVITGTDETCEQTVPGLAKALKSLPKPPYVIVAGKPESEIMDGYLAAGVDEFIHARSNVYKTLLQLAQTIGVLA